MPIMCDVGLIVKKFGVFHVKIEIKKVSQKKGIRGFYTGG
jgi:hypothetical protein